MPVAGSRTGQGSSLANSSKRVVGLLVFGEDAGCGVAGKPRVEAGEGGGDALLDAGGAGGVGLGEGSEAFAEAGRVLLRDGEDADAALGAAGAADEVRAAAGSGGGEGGGYDLDQVRRHGDVLSRIFGLFGVCTPPLGIYHGFVHGKGFAVLYIQILVDGKGVASVYIQIGMWVAAGSGERKRPVSAYTTFHS